MRVLEHNFLVYIEQKSVNSFGHSFHMFINYVLIFSLDFVTI